MLSLLNTLFMKKINFPQKLIIIRNIYWAANQHIRIITEGSCDTEDGSNDNSAVITEINYILQYIKKEKYYFKSQYFTIAVFIFD